MWGFGKHDKKEAIYVGIIFKVEDWPEERFPDRDSLEEALEDELFGEDAGSEGWLEQVGAGSGMGEIDIGYKTTDPKRFLRQARKALKSLQMPASTRISIPNRDGNPKYHSIDGNTAKEIQ